MIGTGLRRWASTIAGNQGAKVASGGGLAALLSAANAAEAIARRNKRGGHDKKDRHDNDDRDKDRDRDRDKDRDKDKYEDNDDAAGGNNVQDHLFVSADPPPAGGVPRADGQLDFFS